MCSGSALAEVLALLSALAYGIVDFAGGRVARQVHPYALALRVQAYGVVAMLVAAPLSSGVPSAADLGWGAVSGAGSGVAIMFLYRGMRRGQISLIVPLTALVGASLPVLFSIAALGERPSPWVMAGMAGALAATWLVSFSPAPRSRGPISGFQDAVVAGAGVALQYAAIAQASDAAGLWPLLANRMASVIFVAAYARHAGVSWRLPRRQEGAAAWIGAVAAASLALYLYASWQSIMSIAVVLASLYPAVPVALGILLLKETLQRRQSWGLCAAALSVSIIILG
ncbi:multidrug DMT transporter permease [Achromobacter sp. K91]|uniref:EamA family transporter n=1 Tax=Achromobacter sp. K91 TaxID=2292262 RepID=UPI000E662B33|nr:EamA family transporter [Achromobacter sp. K91]RII99277.1 multidrug DMT transporter permease [Achromobacter sp. K91]